MTTVSPTSATPAPRVAKVKSLESWIWEAACSIRGASDAAKYKDFILPLVFVKRLCDVYDDEVNRIAAEVGSREKAFRIVEADKQLVRFYLPLKPIDPDQPVWSVIRTLSDHIGERLTDHMRSIADANPLLKGIIDRIDFNATTHGQRDLDDDRLSNLIEAISAKRLGLNDVEADIIGRSYEYLIRKFAEGSGRSAGEFYTPAEVGIVMARIMAPVAGAEVYDPCCGSGGLLIKSQLVAQADGASANGGIRLYGQENEPATWAMANMNMIIHDMEGDIQIGDTFRRPHFRVTNRLRTFDRVLANPMWNQKGFSEQDYDNDELSRFARGFPGSKADWGWMQHILASLKPAGRAAVVLDTGAVTRGSGGKNANKERDIRQSFVDEDLIEGVIYLPENLFYNTNAAGIVVMLNKQKPEQLARSVYLVNASDEFVKGDPKNYLSAEGIDKIVEAYTTFAEIDGFARFVPYDEIVATDYNLSPMRHVDTGKSQNFRDIADLVDELDSLEAEAAAIDDQVRGMLKELGL